MNILQLRDTINQLLSGLIGTYTLPNSTQQPALYVVGQQGVPKGWKATGLEVTIRQYPRQTSRPLVGAVQINQRWEVMLVNYTPSSKVLEEAILRLLRHFPDATTSYQEYSDVAYEQYRVVIPETETLTQFMPRQ